MSDTEYRRDVLALSEGDAMLTLPAKLTPDDFHDIERWIDLVVQKLRRIARREDAVVAKEE